MFLIIKQKDDKDFLLFLKDKKAHKEYLYKAPSMSSLIS